MLRQILLWGWPKMFESSAIDWWRLYFPTFSMNPKKGYAASTLAAGATEKEKEKKNNKIGENGFSRRMFLWFQKCAQGDMGVPPLTISPHFPGIKSEWLGLCKPQGTLIAACFSPCIEYLLSGIHRDCLASHSLITIRSSVACATFVEQVMKVKYRQVLQTTRQPHCSGPCAQAQAIAPGYQVL